MSDHAAFKVTVEGSEARAQVVLAGEIDIAAADAVLHALERVRERGGARVTVDLSGVTFLDSAGVGAFARFAAGGGDLALSGATGIASRVLAVSGLLLRSNVTAVGAS